MMWSIVSAVLLGTQLTVVTGTFAVTTPQQPVSIHLGGSVTLPCWLSPAVNAEAFEIRWYRPSHFTEPVLLYRDKQVQNNNQDLQYIGRDSLVLKDPKSRGLQEGDVSLQLNNVRIEDSGQYLCYVSSNEHYDNGAVVLNVIALGTPPVMSMVPVSDSEWNVSCASQGWHPKPDLQWSDSSGFIFKHYKVQYKNNSELVSVSSWILVPDSHFGWLSCTISIPGGESQEGRLKVKDTVLKSGPWRTAFFVTLIAALLLIVSAVMWFIRQRKRDSKPGALESVPCRDTEEKLCPEEEKLLEPDHENNKLLDGLVPDDVLENMKSAEVDITLDEATAHRNLSVKQKIVRDALDQNNEHHVSTGSDSKKFTHHTCVLAVQFINSGQAYWEIELHKKNVGLKKSWAVGIATEKADRHSTEPLSSRDGFWVLSLKDGKFHISTDDGVVLPAEEMPRILGVFVDYNKGKLSFIDVKEKKYILTILAKFTENVYPLFDPRVGDKVPMTILSKASLKSNQ